MLRFSAVAIGLSIIGGKAIHAGLPEVIPLFQNPSIQNEITILDADGDGLEGFGDSAGGPPPVPPASFTKQTSPMTSSPG